MYPAWVSPPKTHTHTHTHTHNSAIISSVSEHCGGDDVWPRGVRISLCVCVFSADSEQCSKHKCICIYFRVLVEILKIYWNVRCICRCRLDWSHLFKFCTVFKLFQGVFPLILLFHTFAQISHLLTRRKVAGSIPLVCMSKCPWVRYWTPDCSWCARRTRI